MPEPRFAIFEFSAETGAWLDAHPEEARLLSQFAGLMATELAANNDKGNRPGWLTMDRKQAIAEVHWHASKLAVAAKAVSQVHDETGCEPPPTSDDAAPVIEYAADVANCALMVLDCMGLLTQPLREETP